MAAQLLGTEVARTQLEREFLALDWPGWVWGPARGLFDAAPEALEGAVEQPRMVCLERLEVLAQRGEVSPGQHAAHELAAHPQQQAVVARRHRALLRGEPRRQQVLLAERVARLPHYQVYQSAEARGRCRPGLLRLVCRPAREEASRGSGRDHAREEAGAAGGLREACRAGLCVQRVGALQGDSAAEDEVQVLESCAELEDGLSEARRDLLTFVHERHQRLGRDAAEQRGARDCFDYLPQVRGAGLSLELLVSGRSTA